MICKPDLRLAGLLLSALLLGSSASATPAGDALKQAGAALDRGDGVAGEMAGRQALQDGADRAEAAAFIGEGELLQGNLDAARQWLGPAQFAPASRARGFHALGLLEMQQGNLAAAQAAFDRMLQAGPPTAAEWVDIGRLRYRRGDHHAALAAARTAIGIGPRDPAAMEFMAELQRDAYGLTAALPLLHQAVRVAPGDMTLLGQYAATLGDSGHSAGMLAVARQMVKLDPRAPQAYFLQAVLAARAGRDTLARNLMGQTRGAYDQTAAGMLVEGILQYRSGSYALAVEQFAALHRLQPMNPRATMLFARALVADGDANVAVPLLLPLAGRGDAPPYVLVLLGRAYEQLGERDRAAVWLDRAAASGAPALAPMAAYSTGMSNPGAPQNVNAVMQMRAMLGDGQQQAALQQAEQLQGQHPGSIDYATLAGDAELLAGSPQRALDLYASVAEIRSNFPLVRRQVAALQMLGRSDQARRMLAAHLLANPRSIPSVRLLAKLDEQAGEPARATALLRYASRLGSGPRDPQLLADLALQEVRAHDLASARRYARAANALQPDNRTVAAVMAMVSSDSAD